jgi:hypothetical protein
MPTIAFEKQRTALLVVDPYNDFISTGRCRLRARASLRNRHHGPSSMEFEDEVEQSEERRLIRQPARRFPQVCTHR